MTQNNFQSDHTIAVCIDGRSVAWASGSEKKFDFEKIVDTIDVVVVFPCDPATTTFLYKETMFASMSPLL